MVTDFHSHVLPNVDDGSADVEMSLKMLRLEAQQGISHVIATPHFYPQKDSPEAFLARRDAALKQLRAGMSGEELLPELSVGAEVYYFRGMSDCDFLPYLTLQGKKCILIEMPSVQWTDYMYRDLADIWQKQGLIPIIAHLDRYIHPLGASRVLRKLEELPVYVQVNASAFMHGSMRALMLRLLRNGQVHLLGSDCHDMDERKPNLAQAVSVIQKHLGSSMLTQIEKWEKEVLSV